MPWKTLTSFLLIACLLLATACGGRNTAENNGKVELTLWYWNRSMDDQLLKQVSKQFPNINFKAEKIGGDFKAKLMSAFAAGSGAPDIVGLNDWISIFFPNRDQFVNLFELGSKELEPTYLNWKWQKTITPDGQYQIALPMDSGPTALFYRADLFAQAGLPTDPNEVSAQLKTWDDYIAAGQKMQQALNNKVHMFDNITTVFAQNLAQSDKLYFDEQDRFVGDSPHIKKAWDTAVKVHELGLSAKTPQGMPEWNAAMNNGAIASLVGAVWTKQVIQDAAKDSSGKWRVARAPGGDGNSGGSFVGITKQSKHPKEAYEVIKWLQNPENQLTALGTTNLFPSTPSIYGDPKMATPEPFFGNQATNKIFSESAKNVKPAYFGPKNSIADTIVRQEINNVETQNKPPEAAWNDAISRVNQELLLY
ncbi:ABC transporter substrate-binding protein [Paenibacillus xerothermodurans]|uniref:Carbohydrate ABC transporter substrate-binding protein n=1 Tax=Paenibacillus xerothermodurans TaxID=1977292 RepID=A0A2W1N7U9_PAEXE|nr:ABC transporter substrate-binding protein [Paenibacillus xerothermodurans]PZE19251.1 carbohydrate ABC transporter substrate-binding protein [Paenibacillus xerothermodurans]